MKKLTKKEIAQRLAQGLIEEIELRRTGTIANGIPWEAKYLAEVFEKMFDDKIMLASIIGMEK